MPAFDQAAHIAQREERWRRFLAQELTLRFEFVGWFLVKKDIPLTLFAGFVRPRGMRNAHARWWYAGPVGQSSHDMHAPFRTRTRNRAVTIRGPLVVVTRFAVKPEACALLDLQLRTAALATNTQEEDDDETQG